MIVPTFNPQWREEFATFGPDAQAVWRALVSRQRQVVQAHCASDFLRQLRRLDSIFHRDGVPDLVELSRRLHGATGWTLDWNSPTAYGQVDLNALAERSFKMSAWLRDHRSFDHPASPDLFHDVFGRLPALMCADFADLMCLIGQTGMQFPSDAPEFHQLQRAAHRLSEFSLLAEVGASPFSSYKLFGASLVSDFHMNLSAQTAFDKACAYSFNALIAPHASSAPSHRLYQIPSWKQVAEDLMHWFTARKSSSRPDPLCSETVQCF